MHCRDSFLKKRDSHLISRERFYQPLSTRRRGLQWASLRNCLSSVTCGCTWASRLWKKALVCYTLGVVWQEAGGRRKRGSRVGSSHVRGWGSTENSSGPGGCFSWHVPSQEVSWPFLERHREAESPGPEALLTPLKVTGGILFLPSQLVIWTLYLHLGFFLYLELLKYIDKK